MYFILDENGVINVHPDIVKIALLHLGWYFFFSLSFNALIVNLHKESEDLTKSLTKKLFKGILKIDANLKLQERYKVSVPSQSLNKIVELEKSNFSIPSSHLINLKKYVCMSYCLVKVDLKKAGFANNV